MASSYYQYETAEGDTFDIISLAFYGDEHYSTEIMKSNPDHVGTIIFSSGVSIKIPVIEQPAASTLPPWKR
ncbi:MAG TPA: tail protein X [Clostridia bacterium]|nr:tail protein X [Clostridia bacterium]